MSGHQGVSNWTIQLWSVLIHHLTERTFVPSEYKDSSGKKNSEYFLDLCVTMSSLKSREQTRLELLTDIAELQRKNPGQEIYLSTTEAGILCYCGEKSVRRMIKDKLIVAIKPTRELRVSYSSLIDYFEKSKAYAIAGCRDRRRGR